MDSAGGRAGRDALAAAAARAALTAKGWACAGGDGWAVPAPAPGLVPGPAIRTPGANCSSSGSAVIPTSSDSRAIRLRNMA